MAGDLQLRGVAARAAERGRRPASDSRASPSRRSAWDGSHAGASVSGSSHDAGYGWGQTLDRPRASCSGSLSNALGGIGGGREKQHARARRAASRPRATSPSPELDARLRDPVWLALSWGSGIVVDRDPRPDDLEAGRTDARHSSGRTAGTSRSSCTSSVPRCSSVRSAATRGRIATRTLPRLAARPRLVSDDLALVVFPAWLLMRLAGATGSTRQEDIPGRPGRGSGSALSSGTPGCVFVVITILSAWSAACARPERPLADHGAVAVISGPLSDRPASWRCGP